SLSSPSTHLPCPSSSPPSALSFLIPPICPVLPHPPHLPCPSSSPPSALSFLIFLTQVDLDTLECRVLSVACPPFPSSPSHSS
ncbi:unnamed protein product, partial [Closterium sp. NIES-65]